MDFRLDEYWQAYIVKKNEDAFVNIKEACMRLQEKTNCPNKVVIDMLNNLSDFYTALDESQQEGGAETY